MTHANPIGGVRKPGTVGLPYPDTDAQIVDVETGTRVLPPGVFFRAAHRRLFHRAMAASSRSPARRAGRWSDHPKARNTRQTWPG